MKVKKRHDLAKCFQIPARKLQFLLPRQLASLIMQVRHLNELHLYDSQAEVEVTVLKEVRKRLLRRPRVFEVNQHVVEQVFLQMVRIF